MDSDDEYVETSDVEELEELNRLQSQQAKRDIQAEDADLHPNKRIKVNSSFC